LKTVI
jgi:hypothetical protein